MKGHSIREELKKRIIVGDGAMGTMLERYGYGDVLPEVLNFMHPLVVEKIHKGYLDAGSDFVCTNTFGANSYKLSKTGYDVDSVIARAVAISRKAGAVWTALDVAPIGKLMEPTGALSFDEACLLFSQQIKAGIREGVDLFVFETFTDIHELKAAVITARGLTDLPIFCSVSFQEDGRTLMGTDPLTAVNILQDLGIDALGINCSLGPSQMAPFVLEMLRWSKLPVLVQPNAGLPRIEGTKTVFDVGAEEFLKTMKEMIDAGARIVGGCCGTDPEYIRRLASYAKNIEGYFLPKDYGGPFTAASSGTRTVVIGERIHVIGERINPTGKKLLKEALKSEDLIYIEKEALDQVKAGADILDVNVGLPEIDEKTMMEKAVRHISAVTDAPLQIDSADPGVLEAAARICNGKPILNSVNGKQEVMDKVFPIVKKYGTNVIALTLDDKGLPADEQERLEIAKRIMQEAEKYGIGRERILLDCLTLTVSADQNAGTDTLKAVKKGREQFGVNTVLGISNVSFGLPNRKLINQAFLTMALEAGLSLPIIDPSVPEFMDAVRAFEALSGKDEDCKEYISQYGGKQESAVKQKTAEMGLEDIIIDGHTDLAKTATYGLLKTRKPLDIVEKIIIPALTIVGDQYEKGDIFLPQLVRSADTVRASFVVLKEAMKTAGEDLCYGKIILATVKGDIHDIGKNIVKVMLENYGYKIIDLGKDTDIELIVKTALEEDIKLVGLSALMTTTVLNMKATIQALKDAGLRCKVAVGGAVLNPEYAKDIGADYYCKDAMDGVRVANGLFRGQ